MNKNRLATLQADMKRRSAGLPVSVKVKRVRKDLRRGRALSLRHLYGRLRYQSKSRGLEMQLTWEQFLSLRASSCHYCGGTLPIQGIGLDRKDNGKDYTWENSVPCCSDCNYVKGDDLTHEEMLAVMELKLPALNARLSSTTASTVFSPANFRCKKADPQQVGLFMSI